MGELNPGIKTGAFWLTALAVLAALTLELVTPTEACDANTWIFRVATVLVAALAAVGYSLGRGKAKAAAGGSERAALWTTEFWLTMAVAALGTIPIVFESASCPGDPQVVKIATAIAAALAVLGYGRARQIGKPQP